MKQIASAFVKAQKQFGPALKSSSNPHFKSKYADLATCVEAVIEALNDNGIGMIQQTHEDASGVTVETVFLHESGEQISSGKLHVPASKQDPQGYGSALTYARRYSLMAACGIAPEDDDGNAASRRQPEPERISGPQAERIARLAAEVSVDLPAMFKWLSDKAGRPIKVFNELTTVEADAVTKQLETKKQPQKEAA